ncbi:MAG: hypothetical protein CMQ34_09790 [Gammaproteobacteria bacterium]|nr:hypothetical protein [Gammaproteobacteria bacterium]|tara:strand:- start:643 stop:1062 length:420 start_codon:yes stop_codon:yes gene_type:complete
MATQNKAVLGYIQCADCGERGSVHAAAGRRNQLYKRCGCGCDQRNGAVVQSRLWYETEWLDGMKPEKAPAQVQAPEDYSGQVDRIDQQPRGVAADDETGQQTEIRPESKPENEPDQPDKTGLWWLAGGVAALAVLVGRA